MDGGAPVMCYVGADCRSIQGSPYTLTGPRCYSAAHGPNTPLTPEQASQTECLLDSGAFTDVRRQRLDPAGALQRQLAWEERAARKWGNPGWQATWLVSYDTLIDEKATSGVRRKERWSVSEGEQAVQATVGAAAYLASRRRELQPRRLVLAAQGVDTPQYLACARAVLAHAAADDTLGLGGWCIVGRSRRWLPILWDTLWEVLQLVREAGLSRVHLFGVLYLPALGGLLWLADRFGLQASTDSAAPALACTWPDLKKAGALANTWEANVAAWQERLANLRHSDHYREPPRPNVGRQLVLFGGAP